MLEIPIGSILLVISCLSWNINYSFHSGHFVLIYLRAIIGKLAFILDQEMTDSYNYVR